MKMLMTMKVIGSLTYQSSPTCGVIQQRIWKKRMEEEEVEEEEEEEGEEETDAIF